MVYLLDAHVPISAKNGHYGFDFCPACWWAPEAKSFRRAAGRS